MKYIAFFYPSQNIGGAQLLFARLAVELIETGKKVVIIDLKHGFVSSYVSERTNEYIFYQFQEGTICEVKEEVCLVQHLSSIHVLYKQLKLTKTSNFVFWSIHPHNVMALKLFTPLYTRGAYRLSKWISRLFEPLRRQKVKKLLNELNDKHALYFMDESNYLPSKEIGLFSKEVEYLPIPIVDKEGIKNRIDFEVTNYAWIGRITDEKIRSFDKVILDLDNSSNAENIIFHIIGYGELSVLEKLKNIKVINHGIKSKEELDQLLMEEIDCVFAMGTSVLESATLAIPSILCDLSKKKFPKDYKYKFIFETKHYSLGTSASRFTGKLGIEEITDLMGNQKEYNELGRKCKEYSDANHSMNIVSSKLLEAIRRSKFINNDLKEYYN